MNQENNMFVHNDNSNVSGHIEFVSYTGGFPNLCSGTLTLKIDGEEVRFGHDYLRGNYNSDGNYDSFWVSGGGFGFTNDWSDSYVYGGKWIICEDDLPKKYQQYTKEIDEVFNNNVPYGCCGGCL